MRPAVMMGMRGVRGDGVRRIGCGRLVGRNRHVAAGDGFDCHEGPRDGALEHFDVDFDADAVALLGLSQPLTVLRLQQEAGVEGGVRLHLNTQAGIVEAEHRNTHTTTHDEEGSGRGDSQEEYPQR